MGINQAYLDEKIHRRHVSYIIQGLSLNKYLYINLLVLLISLLIVSLLCSLVFVTYLWINLANENKINSQLILDIKNDIKKSIVDNHIKNNSNKLKENQKRGAPAEEANCKGRFSPRRSY